MKSTGCLLWLKIATVREMLKQWNKFEFGYMGHQLREVHKDLKELRQCPGNDVVHRMNMLKKEIN